MADMARRPPIAARVRAALHRGPVELEWYVPVAFDIAARVRAALHRGGNPYEDGLNLYESRRAYAPPFIEARPCAVRPASAPRSRRAYAPPFIEAWSARSADPP